MLQYTSYTCVLCIWKDRRGFLADGQKPIEGLGFGFGFIFVFAGSIRADLKSDLRAKVFRSPLGVGVLTSRGFSVFYFGYWRISGATASGVDLLVVNGSDLFLIEVAQCVLDIVIGMWFFNNAVSRFWRGCVVDFFDDDQMVVCVVILDVQSNAFHWIWWNFFCATGK